MIKAILLILIPILLFAQHRGDNLAFQGVFPENEFGVKPMAMGGAYGAMSGDLNSIFYNPAGLAEIKELQLSIDGNLSNISWQENQEYRPNRIYWTMAFYLEGLYTPDPANNHEWDYNLAQDSSYIVNTPLLGKNPYSKSAADWQREKSNNMFNNISAAMPVNLLDQKFVISAAYRKSALWDYDRNDTYLNPHIGYDGYGIINRAVTDTVTFYWSEFERIREGDIQNYFGNISYQLNDQINLGIGLRYYSSNTDDYQELDRVGYFDIAKDNRFRFGYDTLRVRSWGESDFSGYSLNFGAQYKFKNISTAFNIVLPYTLTRDYSYKTETVDTSGSAPS